MNESDTMQVETVFEVLAEGGGLSILRVSDSKGQRFIYYHREADITDEGMGINKTHEYENFEKPFQLIHNKYNWYLLSVTEVHPDYRNYVIENLLEKLNQLPLHAHADVLSRAYRLEEALQIKLQYTVNEPENRNIWSCG